MIERSLHAPSGVPDHVRLESAACPFGCAASDTPVLTGHDRLHGVPGRFSVIKCNACGLIRTDPRPTPDTIGAYYPGDYAPYHADAAPPAATSVGAKASLRRLLGFDTRQLPPMPPGRLLEVGCANGTYLEHARRLGWTVQGIEFSDSAAALARTRGLAVQTAGVDSATPPSDTVDVIAAWMVIEHLHDPIAALNRMRAWVRPGGYLIASVPDAGGWLLSTFGERRYDLHLPAHLYHFSDRTFAKLLNAGGWDVEHVVWQRNCNSLLWSLEYLCADKQWTTLGAAVGKLRTANSGWRVKLRMLLHWLAGLTRQSGRIEVWARPSARGMARSNDAPPLVAARGAGAAQR